MGRKNANPRADRSPRHFNKQTQENKELNIVRALRRRGVKHYSSFVAPVTRDGKRIVLVKDREDCFECGYPISAEDLANKFHTSCKSKLPSFIPPPRLKFPGGGPDREDGAIGAVYGSYELVTAMRNTAMRELTEETGLIVATQDLVYLHYIQKKPWHAWVGFVGVVSEIDEAAFYAHECHEIMEKRILEIHEAEQLMKQASIVDNRPPIYEAHLESLEKLMEILPYIDEWAGKISAL